MPQEILRNSEGVATDLRFANDDATPSELRVKKLRGVSSGLPKRNPGLELANAFSVKNIITLISFDAPMCVR